MRLRPAFSGQLRAVGIPEHKDRTCERGIGDVTRSVQRPPLLGLVDGIDALVHPSQRLVEDLHLFATSFVGRLGGAASTFGFHSRRTLSPQKAEVLLARSPSRLCRSFNCFSSMRSRASG